MDKRPIVRSIALTSAALFATQCVIFALYAVPYRFAGRYVLPFAIGALAFHLVIAAALYGFRNDFVKLPGEESLDRVNLANRITLFRLSTLPTLLIVIIASKDYRIRAPLIVLVALVFITDFLDGLVSRRGHEVTRIGKMLDSASDYAVLFVISIVYYYFHLIPAWFLWLLCVRLVGQACMMLAVLVVKKSVTPKTSFMGKLTIATTMGLYTFELLRFVAPLPERAYAAAEYAVGAIVALSIFDKVGIMVADLQAAAPANPGTGRILAPENGENDAH